MRVELIGEQTDWATTGGQNRMSSIERWHATWQGLGVAEGSAPLYREVISGYSEPHRHYHTAQHLDECFVSLERSIGRLTR